MTVLLTATLGFLLAIAALWGRRQRQRLLETIEVVTMPGVGATRLGNARDVWVYLPPGYHLDGHLRYPVLYINDGQDRAALGLRESLARLSAAGRIEPIIVVAVPTNENRLHEYGTSVAMNRLGLGLLAKEYAFFIVEELMPLIEKTFRANQVACLLGASLGGLSAFDVAWNYPGRFAAVGVMSGSFWWRAADDEEHIDAGRRIAHSMARGSTAPPAFRLWFQAGSRDEVCDRDGDGVIDAIQDTLELRDALLAAGCQSDQITYTEIEGGRHDYETWSRVLPEFLTWAFSPGQARYTTQQSSSSRPPP